MADCNNQLQLVSEDSIFDLTPTDHDYVLRLLDVSSLSIASSSESERTPDCRASFKSEDQPTIGEFLSTPSTWVIIAVKSLKIVNTSQHRKGCNLPRTSSTRPVFRDLGFGQDVSLSRHQEASLGQHQEIPALGYQQVFPVGHQEVSLNQRQELGLSSVEHQEVSPTGNNSSLPPDSLSESSTLLFELFDLLEAPPSPYSSPPLPSPGTPPTSSVYYSTTEETENCAAESPTLGAKNRPATPPKARPVGGNFATSYQQLVDSCSFDLDQENIVPSLDDPSDNLGNSRLILQNKTPSQTQISDIDESITSPPIPTTSVSNSTRHSLRPHPYLPHAEYLPPRRRFANKIRNRLSSIFGERRVTL
ncbi:uncharacterized protein N7503_008394 [Penicillium pulvis]|uniref:uncharacterized protein n=1 Tax=Penicillium pulvis TaxID=1562058 RepID=UPI0025492B23|nr:uncharacterized protein N7503_008394 [Penicillium pulvis]KAJ5792416.1 hypothetical protein N7503_008394 [Penicillium pulvis]